MKMKMKIKMKKLNLVLLTITILSSFIATGQEQNYGGMISQNNDGTFFYMRSSLEMVYIDGGSFPQKDIVDRSWQNYMDPERNFPNQYNKHYADISNVVYNGKKDISIAEMTTMITNYINENHLANKLVQRWFNYNPHGSINYDIDNPVNPAAKINMQTVFERGFYNVNAGDENLMLSGLKREREAQIKDLSVKLLPFTFMTFTKLDFYENEPVARAVRDAAIVTAKNIYDNAVKNGANPNTANLVYNLACLTANAAYAATKDGYTLHSTTWLYRLVWDQNTEAYFYNSVLANPSLLETSSKFKMEHIDCQENKSTVVFSATRTQEQIIDLTVTRNLNKVFRDLQSRNDVFKVWTPLLDFNSMVSPNLMVPITVEGKIITAEIGTQEGLRGGERFSIVDEDGNFYGFAEAKKGMVWDNAIVEGGDDACYYVPQRDKKGQPVTATTFKSRAKNLKTGLYICDPKAPKKMRVAARIGTKEDVNGGDRFFVYIYDVTTKTLKKAGVVTAVKGKIWDNMYYNSGNDNNNGKAHTLKQRDKEGLRTTETLFKGTCKIQPGMFIRRAK